MRLASCNAKGTDDGLSNRQVKRVAKIASRNAEVVGFQEVKLLADKELVLAGLGPQWEMYCSQTNSPICLNKSIWNVLEEGFSTMHPAQARITPTRYVSWVIAEHRKRPGIDPVAFTNGHVINKGPEQKNGWDETPDNREERIRLAFREQGLAVWEEQVQELYLRGLTQFGTGDFNLLDVPKFHKKQKWLDNRGIDKIFYVPGPRGLHTPRFELVESWEVNTPSDHHLNVVRGRLIRTR